MCLFVILIIIVAIRVDLLGHCTIFSNSSRSLTDTLLTSVISRDFHRRITQFFGCISITHNIHIHIPINPTWLTHFGYDMWCQIPINGLTASALEPDATLSKLERDCGVPRHTIRVHTVHTKTPDSILYVVRNTRTAFFPLVDVSDFTGKRLTVAKAWYAWSSLPSLTSIAESIGRMFTPAVFCRWSVGLGIYNHRGW